jgi:branched-chain amino acid transport system ATP-binding protein
MRFPARHRGNASISDITLTDVHLAHGRVVVLRDVRLRIDAHECIGLLGPNGAGKSTLLAGIAGVLTPMRGRISAGGSDVTKVPAERRRRMGLSLVPEGRRVFASLTVSETLRLAHESLGTSRHDITTRIEESYVRFPSLAKRRDVPAGLLSGGEQQMLSLTRAMAGGPSFLLIDEPFMGLAPAVVYDLVTHLHDLRRTGIAMIVADESEALLTRLELDRVVEMRDLSSQA